jgi:hypothetical protein
MGEAKADVQERLTLRTLRGTVEAITLSTSPGQPQPTPGTGWTPGIGSGHATLAGELTVKSPSDAQVTLKLSSDTKVFLGEEAGQLSEISVGDWVKIVYNSDNLVAAKIQVQEAGI